jgi:hypothetical protein
MEVLTFVIDGSIESVQGARRGAPRPAAPAQPAQPAKPASEAAWLMIKTLLKG